MNCFGAFARRDSRRAEMEAAWRFTRSVAIVLATIEDAELPHMHTLMSRYWDRPMDLADATLAYLAKRNLSSRFSPWTVRISRRTGSRGDGGFGLCPSIGCRGRVGGRRSYRSWEARGRATGVAPRDAPNGSAASVVAGKR